MEAWLGWDGAWGAQVHADADSAADASSDEQGRENREIEHGRVGVRVRVRVR
jgi:hypothetical protein